MTERLDAAPVTRATPTRTAWSRPWWLAFASLGALLGLLRAESGFGDSDVLWSVRGGLDIFRTGHLPHADYYSWTVPGKTWVPNSWGWDVVLATVYRIGGLAGIWTLGTALAVALCLLLARAAARLGAQPAPTFMAIALVGELARFSLYARPQFSDYLAVLALSEVLVPALVRPGRSAIRPVTAVGLLQVVWMNLHTSAVLGPVLIAAAGAGLWLTRRHDEAIRRRIGGRLPALVGGAALCCLLTPYGTAPITHIQQVRDASVGYINEWAPSGFSGSGPIFGVGAIVLSLLVAFFAWRAGRMHTVGMLAVPALATASAIRFAPIAIFLAGPELALLIGKLRMRPAFAKRISAIGVAALALLFVGRVAQVGAPGQAVWAPKLVAALPHGCRTLNDYGIGGEILLSRPDVKVSWDGRNDLYGKRVELQVAEALADVKGSRSYLDTHRVTCVLAPRSDRITKALAADPSWRTAAVEGNRVLLLRR